MAEASNASKARCMTWKVPVARGDASHYGKPTFERQSPDDASRRGHVRAPDRCLTRPRAGSRSPLFPRPPRRPRQGSSRRARDRVRDVRLSVPLLPLLRPHHHAAPGKGIRADGEGPVRLRQSAAHHAAPQRHRRRRAGHVRGPAGEVLAAARPLVPASGCLGLPQGPRALPAGARRLGRARSRAAGPLRQRQGHGGRSARGCGARRRRRRRQHAHVLHRGRVARRGGPRRGVPGRPGLGLPQQDDRPGAVMEDRPSFIYRLSVRLAERALPLAALRPSARVFSKLDVWPELTLAARRRGTKLGLISATVALDSSRLRWPARRWAEPAYRALDRVGTISEDDGRRLQQLGARREAIEVTGDTRYDSVAERAERFDRTREPFARLAVFPAGTFTLVAGSTWPADEAVVLPAFVDLLAQVPAARLVLAPHEPNPDHLALIAERARHLKLPRPVRLSQLEHVSPSPVIVVDRVGILADLYALADVAFVGGGYTRAGLHSVLEPAVFGVPVTVGPHWHMSRDAALLIERGGAVALPADGRHPLHSQCLVWYHDPAARRKAGQAGKQLVQQGRGAAERTTALVRELVEGN